VYLHLSVKVDTVKPVNTGTFYESCRHYLVWKRRSESLLIIVIKVRVVNLYSYQTSLKPSRDLALARIVILIEYLHLGVKV